MKKVVCILDHNQAIWKHPDGYQFKSGGVFYYNNVQSIDYSDDSDGVSLQLLDSNGEIMGWVNMYEIGKPLSRDKKYYFKFIEDIREDKLNKLLYI